MMTMTFMTTTLRMIKLIKVCNYCYGLMITFSSGHCCCEDIPMQKKVPSISTIDKVGASQIIKIEMFCHALSEIQAS